VEATKIRRMSPGDMDAVCEAIAQAFADNPNTLAMVRGDRSKAQRMMRDSVRVAKFGRSCSYGLVAEQADRIVGALNAALWPRCQVEHGREGHLGACDGSDDGDGPAESYEGGEGVGQT
jgi:hypothetical protein